MNRSLAERINALMTGGSMSQSDVNTLEEYFATVSPVLTNDHIAEGIALAASSPSFQLY